MKRLIASVASLTVGAILIAVAILLMTFFQLKIDNEVSKRIYLGYDENGTLSELTRKWIDPDYEMQMQFWIFSLQNEEDVLKNGAFPNFTEKGPYVFTERQHKARVTFLMNDTRVSYRNKRYYTFNANSSCAECSLQDQVTIPNIIFQKLVDIAATGGFLVKEAIEMILRTEKRETPFINTTVGEMLFQGYEDPLIESVCKNRLVRPLCNAVGIPTRIGFMYDRNATDDGEYLVGTGLHDRRTIAKVYKWNGMSKLPDSWWFTPQARMINGTDAQLYPRVVSKSENRHIFVGFIKRSIYLRYKESIVFRDVPAYRYSVPSEQYDYFRQENRGFCTGSTPTFFDNTTQPEGCLPSGLLDIGHLLPGEMPIYISGAHFLNSPAVLYQNFSGFQEPSWQDETSIDVEPITGMPIQVKSLSQINVGMLRGNLRVLSNMRNLIMPVLWFNESIVFDEQTKQRLMGGFVELKHQVFIVGLALLGVGVTLWIVFLLISLIQLYRKRSDEESEHLIVQEDNENEEGEN